MPLRLLVFGVLFSFKQNASPRPCEIRIDARLPIGPVTFPYISGLASVVMLFQSGNNVMFLGQFLVLTDILGGFGAL